jgi:hypothetical protein
MKQSQKTAQRTKQNWFFEKINNVDKPLAKLTKRRKEKTLMYKITYEKGDITTNTSDIQRIIKECFEHLYSSL